LSDDEDGPYANIRDPELLGPFVGQRCVEITQHDREEFLEDHVSYIALHFENGYTLTFEINDDCHFTISPPDAGDEGDDDPKK
jgi:hypothetical protein